MNHRIKGISIIVFIVIVMMVLVSSILWKLDEKNQRKANNQYLPNLDLALVDSTIISTKTIPNNFTILIFFNSECEHCVYEASQIRNLLNDQPNINVIFFSTEELPSIKMFAEEQGLVKYKNVYFAHISAAEVSKTFGYLSIPHIFIYDSDQKFIKEFNGETKVEAILKFVNQ